IKDVLDMTQTKLLYKKPALLYDETTMKLREDQKDYNSRRSNKQNRTMLLKRIPLNRLMDLKEDYAFKQLFGNEKNKDITIVFLNEILQRTGRNQIKDISFANTETGGEYVDDKVSRLDLLVVTNAKEWINVEIQFSNKYDMIERSVFYWSRTYLRPFEKVMHYAELRPVIAINILNFDLFNQTERFHTSYHLYEDEEKFKLTNIMEFHFIEMVKLIKDWKVDKLDPRNDVLARWLLMLGMVDHRNSEIYDDIYLELEGISMSDESLREDFQNWEELSMTQEQRLAYESRLKHILDEEAYRSSMERKAKKIEQDQKEIDRGQKEIEQERKDLEKKKRVVEQREHEIEKTIKNAEQKSEEAFARRLLAKGMDPDFVAESTNLTKERVMEIKISVEK